jgi:hypothetical protein
MSTPPDGGLTVPEQKGDAAQALLIVQSLIATPEGRRTYKDNPPAAFEVEKRRRLEEGDFEGKEPQYEHIPGSSRRALEDLSVRELEVLSTLDQTFIDDGLYVEVPDPGKLFFK